MNANDLLKMMNELDDDDSFGDFESGPGRRPRTKSMRTRAPVSQLFDDAVRHVEFTYKAARFEAGWLYNSLGVLYEHQWISDVLRKVKAGKEASVYLCAGGPAVEEPYTAAKVYRPRMLRNLKNDALYREGRTDLDEEGHVIHDDRTAHAIEKRTAFGEEARHQSWIAYEFTTLQALHAAGADVPVPYEMAANAILMGYVGDLDGCAPTLNEVRLDPDEAGPLFERVQRNLDIMLGCDRVHGDLSAYNILYWEGEIALIDFPQVVIPSENRNAFAIFQRDVTRVCEYFARQGVRTDARQLALDLWTAHGRRPTPSVHPSLLDPDDERDRRDWAER